MSNVIRIDEERIKGHLDRIVRASVEETLNALLDAEADRLVGADRYERTETRKDYRSGHYERKLHTRAGEVTLKVPKLRSQGLDTAIIERYRRRESSVEEALMEMYLAGVSVRRVEDITEALWGTRVSPSTVSDLNKKIYGRTGYAKCWAHARRKLKEIFDASGSPIAEEGLKQIAEIYRIEADIRGAGPDQRLAMRQQLSAPLVAAFGDWLNEKRSRISAKSRLGEKLSYIAN
jgi:hypothetical protein